MELVLRCFMRDASDIWISKLPISSNMVRALGRGVAGKVVDLDYSRRFLQASNDSRPPFSPSKASRPTFTWAPAPPPPLPSSLSSQDIHVNITATQPPIYVFYAFSILLALILPLCHRPYMWRSQHARMVEVGDWGGRRGEGDEPMQPARNYARIWSNRTFGSQSNIPLCARHWCCRGHIRCN